MDANSEEKAKGTQRWLLLGAGWTEGKDSPKAPLGFVRSLPALFDA